MIIILSSYLEPSLQVELGKIPNSFVPVANNRLYKHQYNSLKEAFPREDILLTLPDSYQLSEWDNKNIDRLNINLIETPASFSAGKSLYSVLKEIPPSVHSLRLLNGDTLIDKFPAGENVIGLGKTKLSYHWQVEEYHAKFDSVWSGYFSFSDPEMLSTILKDEDYDFTRSIQTYAFKNKSNKVYVEGWHNCGHISTYYKSRASFASTRHFNSINVSDGVLTKRSSKTEKMKSEADWFINTPPALKKYIPQFYNYFNEKEKCGYSIEYIPAPTLNELFVHGRLNTVFWKNIFSKIDDLLTDFSSHYSDKTRPILSNKNTYYQFVKQKSETRIKQYSNSANFRIDEPVVYNGQVYPSLEEVLRLSLEKLENAKNRTGFFHGDMCFSNILYDFRSDTLKVIDPRGLDNKNNSLLYGNLLYDLAKVTHSVTGLYDHIVADQYSLNVTGQEIEFEVHITDETEEAITAFEEFVFLDEIGPEDVIPTVINLFISMLPLHSEAPKRQQAFIANTYRIFQKYHDCFLAPSPSKKLY